jgi:hypothetical protein
LREVWVLLDPDRVFYRSLAVVAEAVPQESPPEDLSAWAQGKIDIAIERLIRIDREALATRPEIFTDEEKAFPLLTESLFIEPELVRSVSVEFNALDPLPRRAFFELMIQGRNPVEAIESGPWDEDGLYNAIQTALAPFGLDVQSGAADDRGRGKGKGRKPR